MSRKVPWRADVDHVYTHRIGAHLRHQREVAREERLVLRGEVVAVRQRIPRVLARRHREYEMPRIIHGAPSSISVRFATCSRPSAGDGVYAAAAAASAAAAAAAPTAASHAGAGAAAAAAADAYTPGATSVPLALVPAAAAAAAAASVASCAVHSARSRQYAARVATTSAAPPQPRRATPTRPYHSTLTAPSKVRPAADADGASTAAPHGEWTAGERSGHAALASGVPPAERAAPPTDAPSAQSST